MFMFIGCLFENVKSRAVKLLENVITISCAMKKIVTINRF